MMKIIINLYLTELYCVEINNLFLYLWLNGDHLFAISIDIYLIDK